MAVLLIRKVKLISLSVLSVFYCSTCCSRVVKEQSQITHSRLCLASQN